MTILLLAGVAYYYFNYEYLCLAGEALSRPRVSRRTVWISFLLNYLLFNLYSGLELHLTLNWTLFFLFFLLEVKVCLHCGLREAAVLSLTSILVGLGLNIIFRSLTAIVLDVPLIAMDNRMSRAGNYKALPVILGFAAGGFSFFLMRSPKVIGSLRLIMGKGASAVFLLRIFVVMYAYLLLNLFLYYTGTNHIVLKLWGIGAAMFVLLGHIIAIYYAARLSQLGEYHIKNMEEKDEISRIRLQEERMRQEAYTDALTGCGNRKHAREFLAYFWEHQVPFCLCFADLDGLKSINDQYGHEAGDAYLVAAAECLSRSCRSGRDVVFRYGGDEFLVLFADVAPHKAMERMREVDAKLRAMGGARDVPLPFSISYGVVPADAAADTDSLLEMADEAMYAMKRKKSY